MIASQNVIQLKEVFNMTSREQKELRILSILETRSLNRFEAEVFGDHCLHSTISTLHKKGCLFDKQWESVPNRFGEETRVKRYTLTYISKSLQLKLNEYKKEKGTQPSKVEVPYSKF